MLEATLEQFRGLRTGGDPGWIARRLAADEASGDPRRIEAGLSFLSEALSAAGWTVEPREGLPADARTRIAGRLQPRLATVRAALLELLVPEAGALPLNPPTDAAGTSPTTGGAGTAGATSGPAGTTPPTSAAAGSGSLVGVAWASRRVLADFAVDPDAWIRGGIPPAARSEAARGEGLFVGLCDARKWDPSGRGPAPADAAGRAVVVTLSSPSKLAVTARRCIEAGAAGLVLLEPDGSGGPDGHAVGAGSGEGTGEGRREFPAVGPRGKRLWGFRVAGAAAGQLGRELDEAAGRGDRLAVRAVIDVTESDGRRPVVTAVMPGTDDSQPEVLLSAPFGDSGHSSAGALGVLVQAAGLLSAVARSRPAARARRRIRILVGPQPASALSLAAGTSAPPANAGAGTSPVVSPSRPFASVGLDGFPLPGSGGPTQGRHCNPAVLPAPTAASPAVQVLLAGLLHRADPAAPRSDRSVHRFRSAPLADPVIGTPSAALTARWAPESRAGRPAVPRIPAGSAPDSAADFAAGTTDAAVIAAAGTWFLAGASTAEAAWLAEEIARRCRAEMEAVTGRTLDELLGRLASAGSGGQPAQGHPGGGRSQVRLRTPRLAAARRIALMRDRTLDALAGLADWAALRSDLPEASTARRRRDDASRDASRDPAREAARESGRESGRETAKDASRTALRAVSAESRSGSGKILLGSIPAGAGPAASASGLVPGPSGSSYGTSSGTAFPAVGHSGAGAGAPGTQHSPAAKMPDAGELLRRTLDDVAARLRTEAEMHEVRLFRAVEDELARRCLARGASPAQLGVTADLPLPVTLQDHLGDQLVPARGDPGLPADDPAGTGDDPAAWNALQFADGRRSLLDIQRMLDAAGTPCDAAGLVERFSLWAGEGHVELSRRRGLAEFDGEHILAGLRRMGVREGTALLASVSLRAVGFVMGGAVAVLEALLEAVGARGTLVMPTFSRPVSVFLPEHTPSEAGLAAEFLRYRGDALRSLHPTRSVVALGPDAAALAAGPEITKSGTSRTGSAGAAGPALIQPDAPFLRLAERGGWVLVAGESSVAGAAVSAALRAAGWRSGGLTAEGSPGSEARLLSRLPDGTLAAAAPTPADPPEALTARVEARLKKAGKLREGLVGRAEARLVRADDLFAAAAEVLAG